MLTPLDDTPWHQLPTTFDHVGTSDPRFFDRLWFAASDRHGGGALQFTLGVYQNMNVVDGGFVAVVDGRQHNLRVSRQLRPRYEVAAGPLRIDVVEPLRLDVDGPSESAPDPSMTYRSINKEEYAVFQHRAEEIAKEVLK